MQASIIPLELNTAFPITQWETKFILSPTVAANWSALLFSSVSPNTPLDTIKIKLSADYGSHTHTAETRCGTYVSQQYFQRPSERLYEFLTVKIEETLDHNQIPKMNLKVIPKI